MTVKMKQSTYLCVSSIFLSSILCIVCFDGRTMVEGFGVLLLAYRRLACRMDATGHGVGGDEECEASRRWVKTMVSTCP